MTLKEAKRLKKIFKCIANAYAEVYKSSDDVDTDLVKIFGTAVKPNWALEDHVHLNCGQIANIELCDEGAIVFAPEHWRDVHGNQITGVISPWYYSKKGKVKKSIFFSLTKGWVVNIGFSSARAQETDYTDKIASEVLHWIIDNFDVESIEEKTAQFKLSRVRKEFGLAGEDSYYLTVPLKEKSADDKATNYQAEATYSILGEDN